MAVVTIPVSNTVGSLGAIQDFSALGSPRLFSCAQAAGSCVQMMVGNKSDGSDFAPVADLASLANIVGTADAYTAGIFRYGQSKRIAGTTTVVLTISDAVAAGAGGGPLTPLAVGDTAVSGNIGTPPLTAAQSVDLFGYFLLTQTTAAITATLAAPTAGGSGWLKYVANSTASTQPITMYGMRIVPGTFAAFGYDGAAWGSQNTILQGGNAFGAQLTTGTRDAQPYQIITNATVAQTILAASQFVGFGATSPASRLHVRDNAGQIALFDGNNVTGLLVGIVNNAAVRASGVIFGGNGHFWQLQTDFGLGNVQSFGIFDEDASSTVPRFQIDRNGLVTITPGANGGLELAPSGVAAGNTGEAHWRELVANGTNYVGFKGADNIAANVIWVLPAADATVAGQPLVSDAALGLTWAAAGRFATNGLTVVPTVQGGLILPPWGVAAGNTSEVRLLELAANGVNFAGFKAPDNLAADTMYTMPTAFPSALKSGASLTSDTTGVLAYNNAMQSGTANIVNGVSAAISCNLAAGTRIFIQAADVVPGAGSLTIDYRPLAADRSNGTPGSFKITAVIAAGTINVLDQSLAVQWHTINP